MKKLILIIQIFITSAVFAQQEPMFTHYMFNTLTTNPGFAGNRNALVVNALHRSQWLGFDGAPRTQTLTVHSPLKNKHFGVGFALVNEKIGVIKSTNIAGSFSYEMLITRTMKIAYGINIGFNKIDADLRSVKTTNVGDPAFATNITTRLMPNLGFGAYFSTEKYYMGLSIPKFFENDFNSYTLDINNKLTGEQKNIYYIVGTILPLYSEKFKFKPSAQLQFSGGTMPKIDITGLIQYDNKFWWGLMLRTADSFGVLLGMNINHQIACGYSFDFSYLNTTVKYNGGSHEIMFQYLFSWEKELKCPAYH